VSAGQRGEKRLALYPIQYDSRALKKVDKSETNEIARSGNALIESADYGNAK
jgi:hypothetical protein